MAHEVGHYLGLSHVDEPHNLMLWNSDRNDTNLNYDPQYRTMMQPRQGAHRLMPKGDSKNPDDGFRLEQAWR